MKPAQIRVFDGLRITTDHVNHLQGALASGFEDFREILGLGHAQTGLAVAVADDGTVTIQPGIAFDLQKNRLACDSPMTLKLTPGAQESTWFICLKYEQVEDGAVESHPTMIWDSCSALVRDAYPAPTENLVALAMVVRDKDGKLHVKEDHSCRVGRSGPDEHEVVEPVIPEITVPPTVANALPPAAAAAGTPPAAVPSVLPAPVTGLADADKAGPLPTASAAPPAAGFRQGVIQLASDPNAASYLRSVVAPALRAKIGSGPIDLSFSLSQMDILPDIATASFAAHCVLSGELAFPAAASAPQPRYAFECISNGEATAVPGGLVQFAASSMNMRPLPAAPGTVWPAADFTGRGLAEFPFAKWSTAPDASRPPLADDTLAGLRLVAQLAPATQGFVFGLKLLWNGQISEDSLKVLETQDIELTWQTLLGWKAVGN